MERAVGKGTVAVPFSFRVRDAPGDYPLSSEEAAGLLSPAGLAGSLFAAAPFSVDPDSSLRRDVPCPEGERWSVE